MYIYSSKQQPFGLLSNNASTPFALDGEAWETVTGYVYANMFKTKEFQQKMLEQLIFPSPYDSLIELKSQEDNLTYKNAIEKAQRLKFEQHRTLRDRLFGTGTAVLDYPDDPAVEESLTHFRTQIAENYRHALWDDLRNVTVSKKEAVNVIKGVEEALEKDIVILDNLTYEELLPYRSHVDATPHYYQHPALDNLNKMVPVIKKHIYKHIYEKQLEHFKDHLLDVQLDDMLRSEYPHLSPDSYERAKHQQIVDETTPGHLRTLKNQLFFLYEKNGLDKSVKDRLQYIPNKDLLEQLASPPAADDAVSRLILTHDDPLMPHYRIPVTIDGKVYSSGVHYAYHILFSSIGQADRNLDEYSPLELVRLFETLENQWVIDTLTINNEKAHVAKFSIPTLSQLLLLTGDDTLIWDDKTDPVLGSAGQNRAGQMMEHLRAQAKPSLRRIESFAANLFFVQWMLMRAQDYKTTLDMSKVPTTDYLIQIYMCPRGESRRAPKAEERLLKKKAKLTQEQLNILWPLLAYPLGVLHPLTEQDAMTAIVEAQKRLNKQPTPNDLTHALLTLDKVYTVLKSQTKPEITKQDFTNNLLKNSWNRINYWSS